MNITTRALAAAAMDLLDQTRDALVVWDLDGHIQYMNRAAERLLGWTLAEARGCPAKQLFFERASDFDAARETLLRTGEWFGEMRLSTRSSEPVIVESRWTLKRGDKDLPARVVVVNTDITGRKQLEEAILDSSRQNQRQIGEALQDGLCERLFACALACATLRRKLEDQTLPEAADAARILAQVSSLLKEAHALALGLSPSIPAKSRSIRRPGPGRPGRPCTSHGPRPAPGCRGPFRGRGPRRYR
jgi:PAS domain S-box-containing protein